jgi:hypothetical protein
VSIDDTNVEKVRSALTRLVLEVVSWETAVAIARPALLPRGFVLPQSSQDVSDPPLGSGGPPQARSGGSLTSWLPVTVTSRIVAEPTSDPATIVAGSKAPTRRKIGCVRLRYYLDPRTGEPHIYNHDVKENEVEDILAKPIEDRVGTEGSRIAVGQTEAGRYLRVIYVPDPQLDSAFVITGYDLGPKALKALRRRRRRKK